jgi:hypothetical protein
MPFCCNSIALVGWLKRSKQSNQCVVVGRCKCTPYTFYVGRFESCSSVVTRQMMLFVALKHSKLLTPWIERITAVCCCVCYIIPSACHRASPPRRVKQVSICHVHFSVQYSSHKMMNTTLVVVPGVLCRRTMLTNCKNLLLKER